jgi:hypothetical protein
MPMKPHAKSNEALRGYASPQGSAFRPDGFNPELPQRGTGLHAPTPLASEASDAASR